MINPQMLTGVVAAIGLFANLAGAGESRAQDGHAAPSEASEPAHQHAAFQSDRMHVRIDGPAAGPGVRDIVLIPGLSSSPEVWQGTVDHLLAEDAAHWRIHRVHIQGFAGAPAEGNAEGPVAAPVAEEIARYIAENHIDHPVVVGHSMGGTIGLMLAARHPDSVGRLMVVDMIPFMGNVLGGAEATPESVTPMADQIEAGMANATPADYQTRAAASVTGMIDTESRRAGPLADTAASDQKVSAHSMRELFVTDLRPELAKITVPTEVLYVALKNPGMTPEITDAIYRGSYANLAGARLERVEDSAHFVMLDQPDRFYAALDAFVATLMGAISAGPCRACWTARPSARSRANGAARSGPGERLLRVGSGHCGS